ncbi:site-2 protease family protein [Bacillus sp. FJAT-22090]|uniref:site-2 protease family protein n=1 Tax=Bacillus sp. FJAT-22090 TaxID=1581038 RepID=UPI0011A2079E|nr:site-2 protease family protein [Bacillus sp. FJAT-22090]
MDFLINFVIIALFIFPFIALIHESGHAFFVKLFGGEISEFAIGNGEVLWKKHKFTIKKAYFVGGRVVTKSDEGFSKTQRVFILLGGVIFNFLSAFVLDLFTGYEFGVFRNYLDSFIFVSYLNVVINLFPLTTIIGTSDGKQLVELYNNK